MNVSVDVSNLVNGVSRQVDLLRFPGQVEEQLNAVSSLSKGVLKRPPFALSGVLHALIGVDSSSFIHRINRGDGEFYVVVITKDKLYTLDLEGNTTSHDLPQYLRADNPREDLRALTVADTTFIVNTKVEVRMSGERSPKRSPEALLFIKRINHDASYTIRVYNEGSTLPDYIFKLNNIKIDPNGEYQPTDIYTPNQGDVAGRLIQLMGQGGFGSEYSYHQKGPLIYFRRWDGGDFRVEFESTLEGAVKAFKGETQSATELPKDGFDGFLVKVAGLPDEDRDDYYMQFDGPTPDWWGEGVWRETVKPDVEVALDANTMPHVLVSQSPGVGGFVLKAYEWAKRIAGDDNTNPKPSFVGKRIAAMAWHRNRLCLVHGDLVSLSDVNDPGNFWRTTVSQLLDTDPFDVTSSRQRVTEVFAALPYQRELVLFGEQAQMILTGGEVLTARTATVVEASAYPCTARVLPVSSGDSMYFVYEQDAGSGVYEYFPTGQANNLKAFDIASHVRGYIDRITRIEASDSDRFLFCLSDSDPGSIFVYQWYNTTNERVQSAWHKWTLNAQVLDLWVFRGVAYALALKSGKVVLLKLSLDDAYEGERLDFAFDQTQCAVVYDEAKDITAISPPVPLDNPVLVLEDGTEVVPDVIPETGHWHFDGPLVSQREFIAGEEYKCSLTLTRPILKEEAKGSKADLSPFIVRSMILYYDASKGFDVVISSPNRPDSRVRWNPARVGYFCIGVERPEDSNSIIVPIMRFSDKLSITLENNERYPSSWVKLLWKGAVRRL